MLRTTYRATRATNSRIDELGLLSMCEPADLRDPATTLTVATEAAELPGGTNAGFNTVTLQRISEPRV